METNKIERPKTPELDKIKAIAEQSNKEGDFLAWLETHKKVILYIKKPKVRYETGSDPYEFVPFPHTIEKLLAEYHDIDLDKAEKERAAVLEHARVVRSRLDEAIKMNERSMEERERKGVIGGA